MNFGKVNITNHAIVKYHERVHPGQPLPTGDEGREAFRQAKAILHGEVERSTLLPSQTWRGQEQRLLASGDGVAVCKKDRGWIIVVTILGSGESLYAADEEVVESIARLTKAKAVGQAEHAISTLPKAQRDTLGPAKVAAIEIVEKMVDERIGRIIDGLVTYRINELKHEGKQK